MYEIPGDLNVLAVRFRDDSPDENEIALGPPLAMSVPPGDTIVTLHVCLTMGI
jgi:hypothetical protein